MVRVNIAEAVAKQEGVHIVDVPAGSTREVMRDVIQTVERNRREREERRARRERIRDITNTVCNYVRYGGAVGTGLGLISSGIAMGYDKYEAVETLMVATGISVLTGVIGSIGERLTRSEPSVYYEEERAR